MGSQKSTPLDFALLGLLHQKPMSGYDLRKVFAETALGNYSSSPGAIYPALRRLESMGLVKGREDRATSLRPRRIYRPSADGRRVFRDWLDSEVTREDISKNLDATMLRFSFHWVLASAAATRRLLEELERELESYLEELTEQKKLFPPQAPIHSRLALEAGIEQYRTCVRWARRARRHFTAEKL